METFQSKGRRFGQRRPRLTELIKSILERYPDGGQILKELIQNADDAGATDVKFLFDDRDHGSRSLHRPELAKFQGPALYFYNNATFKEDDWEGIQNLMRSNKKDDPEKVGRFGIGFNSVYHITDLPGIVSGEKIAFLDPHERYFEAGESGRQYSIKHNLLDPSSRDQFLPFHGIFGCDLTNANSYDGTMFRFPLRTTASDLSKKIYTKTMIFNLFESLREEASVILLFLNSVVGITVQEREKNGELRCVFKVEVPKETLTDLKRRRREFLQKAKEHSVTNSMCLMNIQLTFGLEIQVFRWLIVHQIGSNENRISELSGELHLLPWVGVAIPIDARMQDGIVSRIFFFLPLPPDIDCQTGLPVNIHGCFGLTDNRRGLVWPGADCQNTLRAEWNQLLLKKVGVEVFMKVLDVLVRNEPSTGITLEQRRRLVYSILPVPDNVRGHWKYLSEQLFTKIAEENTKIFYAKGLSGDSWISLQEGVLDRLYEQSITTETQEAILKILQNFSSMTISNLPSHVLEIVTRYFPTAPRDISPDFLVSVLRDEDISLTPREDKLLLLEYILRENLTTDLSGVPLLPLANGHFSTFFRHKHASAPLQSVFVPSEGCMAALLPNTKHRFLDDNLPEKVTEKLSAMAANDLSENHPTQLVRLNKEIVVENLHSSLPPEWFNGQQTVQWNEENPTHPPKSWLKDIWAWIHVFFPNSLSSFETIPLIELPPTSNKWLGVLSKHSKLIFATGSSGDNIPLHVSSLLTACGCCVVPNMPSYLCHSCINLYVSPPTPSGVVTVLSRAPLETVEKYIRKACTPNNCVLLREFLCRLPKTVSNSQRDFLSKLPLFNTLSGSLTAVQVNGKILRAASSELRLPLGFKLAQNDQIILCTDANTHRLLTFLAVEILKPAEIVVLYLFPDIKASSVYSAREITTIMQWVLCQMFVFKDQGEGFLEEIKSLPFVLTSERQMKKPAELYDPSDDLLVNLFSEETTKFPIDDFCQVDLVSKLKELGLRTRDMLTACELADVAINIASFPVSSKSIMKIQALIKIIEYNPVYLKQQVDGGATLKDKLIQFKWLPCAKSPPRHIHFPKIVPWYAINSSLFSPGEMRSKSQALLVGASMPIVDVNMNDKLQKEFGLTADPPIHNVVSQLKAVIESWQRPNHSKPVSKFQEMVVAIYLHLSRLPKEMVATALNAISATDWIWHGAGFCSPELISLEKDFPTDLQPHLFVLPEDLKSSSSLVNFFVQQGVRRRFTQVEVLEVLARLREKHAKERPERKESKEVENDLKLCRSILEWLVRDKKVVPKCLLEKVLVPVQSARNMLVLKPSSQCTYCDRDWLRRGESELNIPENYYLVHEYVPIKVAKLIGVIALSTCLLSAEPLGFEYEQIGPYEPITTRLNNILKEYKEGVDIFKELIQNADDAGASKVRFLIDWRLGPKTKLLSPMMAECQDAALWAYNNAEFSDKDFENISKIGGASKVDDPTKIGRFGLGFNAVYHLTDIPSFVSREYFVVFDPNVHHLQSHIQDKSRPGIRINLATNPRPLSAFSNQFQPYHNIFDCNTQCSDGRKFHFDGTLFRFPFRTFNQAKKSEISQQVCDEKKVKEIIHSLKESASLLLLFTQHVEDVELYEIGKGNTPKIMERVLSIKKRVKQDTSSRGSFIQECSEWWDKRLKLMHIDSPSQEILHRSEIITINFRQTASALTGNNAHQSKQQTWLVTSCVSANASAAIASYKGDNRGLLPLAEVAAKLSNVTKSNPEHPEKWIPEAVEGEAFRFLPLSIATGLPVHVNGFLETTSNRRGIWERNTTDQFQPPEVQWNESLLGDALANAYVQLLQKISCLYAKEYSFFQILWPHYDALQASTWESLVKCVYTMMVKEALPLLWSNGEWLSIHSGYVLSEELRKSPGAVEILDCLKANVFHLTSEVISSLRQSGLAETLENRTLTLETFWEEHFLPNLTNIPQDLRDRAVWFGLDCIMNGRSKFVKFIKENCCISSSRANAYLAKPCELISPKGAAASLFSSQDGRFPVGEGYLTGPRLAVLEQLGMVKDKLSWQEISERAESVEKLAAESYKKALKRVQSFMKYLNTFIGKLPQDIDVANKLQRIKFLPIMSKPPLQLRGLPWKGSDYEETFHAPEDVFLENIACLVGSSSLVGNDSEGNGCGYICPEVRKMLGICKRQPDCFEVLLQLDTIISSWSKLSEEEKLVKKIMVDKVCKDIYKYLDEILDDSTARKLNIERTGEEGLKEKLRKETWLFVNGCFVSSKKVARKWTGNAAPFLYSLPEEYNDGFNNLLRAAGVKEFFEESDFINALYSLKVSTRNSPLTDNELNLAVRLLNELKKFSDDVLHASADLLCLPDANKVLCQSNSLTINTTPWLPHRRDERYVHDDVTPKLAFKLGAKELIDRRLQKYSNTVVSPFGQHENLTDRLKNILKAYPCDSGILKELVQNADDAKASEIHFIYDTRSLPCKRAIQNHAEELKGPALCVYNNGWFSEVDLKGIQNLGIGGKRDDLGMTGQFGVGFNAVYHLTDCPSFLSNDNTLCFFDPHRRYCRQASVESPGEMFSSLDESFKEDFSDVLLGYHRKRFPPKGSTMFRFPLRSGERCKSSLISEIDARDEMPGLFEKFKSEARKTLLFLNNVKKISMSKIDENGKFERQYEVNSIMDEDDEKEKQKVSAFVTKYKNAPTHEIPKEAVTYSTTLSDSNQISERWLVHQRLGAEGYSNSTDIPDGRPHGLLPLGGIAALITSAYPENSTAQHSNKVAHCVLPLPIQTGLPVQVNGHFALNPSRRALWKDMDSNDILTKWNEMIKSQVLAPAYATLILKAQNYIPGCEIDSKRETERYFSKENAADFGLSWYYGLFPNVSVVNDAWKILAIEVYRFLEKNKAAVFPEVDTSEPNKGQDLKELPQRILGWLSIDEMFFVKKIKNQAPVFYVLLRIGFPLSSLSAPKMIQKGFQKADVSLRFVTPESVVAFLHTFGKHNSSCKIGQLPNQIEETPIGSITDLKSLICYCSMEKESFVDGIVGLPLLLTADGQLRVFPLIEPVYCSKFSDLFPNHIHLFVHSELVDCLSWATANDQKWRQPQALQDLTPSALASFMSDVFPPTMKGSTKHLPFPRDGLFSEKWLKRLWELLEHHAKPNEHGTQVSLTALGEWPIVPTLTRKLVTVDNAKTVLDMAKSGKEIHFDKKVREILKKVRCPVLDKTITQAKSSTANVPHAKETTTSSTKFSSGRPVATDPIVAHPHSVADILHVLEYMLTTGSLDLSHLTDGECAEMLQFIQAEYESLEPKEDHNKILKDLPLHKAINQTRHRLSSFSSYALFPDGVPVRETDKLQQRTGCVFLHSDVSPILDQLYRQLGAVIEHSVPRFYTRYILPHFNIFSRESQVKYLTHIRDRAQPSLSESHQTILLDYLRENSCLPCWDGKLHRASEFFDPRRNLLKVMFGESSNKFPPPPFSDDNWLTFLVKIGLKTDVDESLFLQFCRQVASAAKKSRHNEANIERSKALVKYLLKKKRLRGSSFLRSASTIKFIASEKVPSHLNCLHRQYQCQDKEELPPFLQFSNAIPWEYKNLVWSSAALLPDWAQPDRDLSSLLEVRESPSVNVVINHLQNISGSHARILKNMQALPPPKLLKEIMTNIYEFLQSSIECKERDISDNCDKLCKTIGNRLKTTPCILIENVKAMVKGDQLSFTGPTEKSLCPFHYTVPREYGKCEHILKRLGATEKISALQAAKIFRVIKGQCMTDQLNAGLEEIANNAMFLFFKSVYEENNAGRSESTISNISELFLVSEDRRLVKSNSLVCQVPPRHLRTLARLDYPVLLSLERCDLRRSGENEYLQALPENLRPRKFSSIFCEELDRSCLRDVCQNCKENSVCEFLEKHITIIKSRQFQEGIARLLKHQKNSNELTEKELNNSSKFRLSKVEIKCMESIKVGLVCRKDNQLLEKSSIKHNCYAVKKKDSWILYIQHNNTGRSNSIVLAKCINKILEWMLTDKCLLAMIEMLCCDSPSQIPDVLNDHDIQRDLEEGKPKPGCEASDVFHYLVRQDLIFNFFEGNIVIFDMTSENPFLPTKYVLAEVKSCVKSNTREESGYDFEARYKIDIGDQEKEVSVLDLYKFFQNDLDISQTTNIDVDGIKQYIREVLRASCYLPNKMLWKVVKRLYLSWHPDRHKTNVSLVQEVIEFLRNELGRIQKNRRDFVLHDFFQTWNDKARREKETYRNYNNVYGGLACSFSETSEYVNPDPVEADRWLKQACFDLEDAQFLFSARRSYALVCFLSHQITEKSLKAALYARCGLTKNQLTTHDVSEFAQNLRDSTGAPSKVVELAGSVAQYYLQTRYPNCVSRQSLPATEFGKEHAKDALESARKLLNLVKELVK